MNAHWSCKKGQGKKTYIQGHFSYQRNRNSTRKQQKCWSVWHVPTVLLPLNKERDFSGFPGIIWRLLSGETHTLSVPQTWHSGTEVLTHKHLLRTLCAMCGNVSISDQFSLGAAIYIAFLLRIYFLCYHSLVPGCVPGERLGILEKNGKSLVARRPMWGPNPHSASLEEPRNPADTSLSQPIRKKL